MRNEARRKDLFTGKSLIKRMAQEFLEDRLGIEASQANIRRLAAHLIIFEKEVEQQLSNRKRTQYG